MRYLVQALVALAVLIAAPVLMEAPEETWEQVAAIVAALALAGFAYHGAVRFVRSRRPKSYHDSIMPPKK